MNKANESSPKWLTIGQAAEYLGVSRDTLRRWEKKGKIKAVRSPTNRRYYTQKQLDEIMAGKTQSTPPAGGWRAKVPQTSQRLSLGQPVKLVLIGLLSCAAAGGLALLLQSLFLK